jgi:hypothetical protein
MPWPLPGRFYLSFEIPRLAVCRLSKVSKG